MKDKFYERVRVDVNEGVTDIKIYPCSWRVVSDIVLEDVVVEQYEDCFCVFGKRPIYKFNFPSMGEAVNILEVCPQDIELKKKLTIKGRASRECVKKGWVRVNRTPEDYKMEIYGEVRFIQSI